MVCIINSHTESLSHRLILYTLRPYVVSVGIAYNGSVRQCTVSVMQECQHCELCCHFLKYSFPLHTYLNYYAQANEAFLIRSSKSSNQMKWFTGCIGFQQGCVIYSLFTTHVLQKQMIKLEFAPLQQVAKHQHLTYILRLSHATEMNDSVHMECCNP